MAMMAVAQFHKEGDTAHQITRAGSPTIQAGTSLQTRSSFGRQPLSADGVDSSELLMLKDMGETQQYGQDACYARPTGKP